VRETFVPFATAAVNCCKRSGAVQCHQQSVDDSSRERDEAYICTVQDIAF